MIRFEADSAKESEVGVILPGRVREGTIRIGSVLTVVNATSPEVSKMQFQVVGIVAYGHSIEDLPEGMTGELRLTGDQVGTLTQMKWPFTCVGRLEL